MKHLFLEGAVQEGKSTLIRRLIQPFLDQTGGFSSQRLLDSSGETVGFRIVPAAEALELTREYQADLTGIFLSFQNGKAVKAPKLFLETALQYLNHSDGKKLILLDEIGGMELGIPEFREALYRVLSSSIPCIGVLKLEEKNRHMCEQNVIDQSCLTWHQVLRRDLKEQFDAQLISFSRKTKTEAEDRIAVFLEQFYRETVVPSNLLPLLKINSEMPAKSGF